MWAKRHARRKVARLILGVATNSLRLIQRRMNVERNARVEIIDLRQPAKAGMLCGI
jgi:hypothetical protein